MERESELHTTIQEVKQLQQKAREEGDLSIELASVSLNHPVRSQPLMIESSEVVQRNESSIYPQIQLDRHAERSLPVHRSGGQRSGDRLMPGKCYDLGYDYEQCFIALLNLAIEAKGLKYNKYETTEDTLHVQVSPTFKALLRSIGKEPAKIKLSSCCTKEKKQFFELAGLDKAIYTFFLENLQESELIHAEERGHSSYKLQPKDEGIIIYMRSQLAQGLERKMIDNTTTYSFSKYYSAIVRLARSSIDNYEIPCSKQKFHLSSKHSAILNFVKESEGMFSLDEEGLNFCGIDYALFTLLLHSAQDLQYNSNEMQHELTNETKEIILMARDALISRFPSGHKTCISDVNEQLFRFGLRLSEIRPKSSGVVEEEGQRE